MLPHALLRLLPHPHPLVSSTTRPWLCQALLILSLIFILSSPSPTHSTASHPRLALSLPSLLPILLSLKSSPIRDLSLTSFTLLRNMCTTVYTSVAAFLPWPIAAALPRLATLGRATPSTTLHQTVEGARYRLTRSGHKDSLTSPSQMSFSERACVRQEQGWERGGC